MPAERPLPAQRSVASGPLSGRVIVIDPGHNGGNGANASHLAGCNTVGTEARNGLTESAFNWAMAKLVTEQLVERGAEVVLTRTSNTGVGPCAITRAVVAYAHRADALIAIHADGAPGSARGFHVIHGSTGGPMGDRSYEPSVRLATSIRDTLQSYGLFRTTYTGRQGIIERSDLATLRWAGVPAVLIEAGNLRHTIDADDLADTVWQYRFAGGVVDGVTAWVSSQR